MYVAWHRRRQLSPNISLSVLLTMYITAICFLFLEKKIFFQEKPLPGRSVHWSSAILGNNLFHAGSLLSLLFGKIIFEWHYLVHMARGVIYRNNGLTRTQNMTSDAF